VLVATEITAAALAGGFVGLMLVALFDRAGQITDSDYSISVLAGALIAIGIHRALRSP
jgi:hypothetical protein